MNHSMLGSERAHARAYMLSMFSLTMVAAAWPVSLETLTVPAWPRMPSGIPAPPPPKVAASRTRPTNPTGLIDGVDLEAIGTGTDGLAVTASRKLAGLVDEAQQLSAE